MSEDLNKKIKQITDMLGQENIPDNFKGLLNMLAGSAESGGEPAPKPADQPFVKEEKFQKSELEENVEMMRRIKKVMDHVSHNSDPRVNLLNAIRPFLNNSRQKKVNNCIKLLQMASLSRVLDESDKGSF